VGVLALLNMVATFFITWVTVAWSAQIWEGPKNFWGGKMPDFRRITLFFMEKRLSKHKMTIFSKNLGGHCPSSPPGYAYAMLLGLMVSFYHQQSKRIRRYQILA